MNVRAIVFFIGLSLFTLKAALNAAAMNGSGLDCMIEPSSTVNVGSEVIGIIDEITVDRGDIVQKGQVIVRIDSKVERATMESRKARYEFARNEYKRKSGLYAKALIATRDLEESETNLKIANATSKRPRKCMNGGPSRARSTASWYNACCSPESAWNSSRS